MKIIIIGGGLSGLTLANLLKNKNINATVLEASLRIGGRIHTVMGKHETPLELGATWFSDFHFNLIKLLEDLGLQKYPQYSKGISLFQTKSFEPPQKFFVPESDKPSYRIVGGTQALIDKLAQKVTLENIKLNTKVTSITELKNEISVQTANGLNMRADKVVLCLPPQLIGSQIQFSPELPDTVSKLLPSVHTWMSGAIKFVLEYETPFWRSNDYSGMLYSHSGIAVEMYDHSNFEENKYGFTGFLNSGASSYSSEVRKDFVIQQLAALFGNQVLYPLFYSDKVWTDEFVLGGNQIIQRPHQNNGHPMLQQPYMNGKLFFSGTETATEFAGYLEGAVSSARKIVEWI